MTFAWKLRNTQEIIAGFILYLFYKYYYIFYCRGDCECVLICEFCIILKLKRKFVLSFIVILLPFLCSWIFYLNKLLIKIVHLLSGNQTFHFNDLYHLCWRSYFEDTQILKFRINFRITVCGDLNESVRAVKLVKPVEPNLFNPSEK